MFVGATDISDVTAYFTNFGSCVDIFAPGIDILSMVLNNGTDYYQGTSMSAPHVSGVAARIVSSFETAPTPEQVFIVRINRTEFLIGREINYFVVLNEKTLSVQRRIQI